MDPYTVIYVEESEGPFWQFFECQADNGEHAEEQCADAYPTANVVWVNEGWGAESQTMQGFED